MREVVAVDAHAGQVEPGEIGTAEVAALATVEHVAELRARKVSSGKLTLRYPCVGKVGALQVGLRKIAARQLCGAKRSAAEVCLRKVRTVEHAPRKVDTRKIGTAKVDAGVVCAVQVASRPVYSTQIATDARLPATLRSGQLARGNAEFFDDSLK